jgi:hypothetical protein
MSLGPNLPFFAELEDANSILLAGAGGGFDIFTGLPLYFALRNAGKQVHLANLSFSDLFASDARVITPCLVEVTAKSYGPQYYFPEGYLAQWFRTRGEDVPIYCFERTGVKPITEGYQVLAKMLSVDAVILVDGGTDSLMRGDECGLGTPEEDIASIAAVDALDVRTKLLVCLGFGIDHFHGVCHGHVLEAVAELIKAGGFLGAWSILRETPEVELYREATEAVFSQMAHHPSIVNASILSAVDGQFGNYHATSRTAGSELFINPLMALYWGFRLETVAGRNLYLDAIRETRSYTGLTNAIYRFRASLSEEKPWTNIPL